jgi:hypothetical protein
VGVVAGQGGQQSTTSKWRDWGKGAKLVPEPHFHRRQVEEPGSTKSLSNYFSRTYGDSPRGQWTLRGKARTAPSGGEN